MPSGVQSLRPPFWKGGRCFETFKKPTSKESASWAPRFWQAAICRHRISPNSPRRDVGGGSLHPEQRAETCACNHFNVHASGNLARTSWGFSAQAQEACATLTTLHRRSFLLRLCRRSAHYPRKSGFATQAEKFHSLPSSRMSEVDQSDPKKPVPNQTHLPYGWLDSPKTKVLQGQTSGYSTQPKCLFLFQRHPTQAAFELHTQSDKPGN